MKRRDLDEEVPTGDPESVFCRWCGTGRVLSKGRTKGLVCIACDTNTVTPLVADTGSGSV